jgi:hypothetical protein
MTPSWAKSAPAMEQLMSIEIPHAFARHVHTALSRRRTLRGIGLGTLAAAATRPSLAAAGNDRKKIRKRIRKKCRRQIDACRESVTELCNSVPDCEEETLAELLTCCPLLANCRAGASLDCFFSKLN